MELTIECSKRDPKAKANALRRQGLLPAVLYGHDGANSVSLTVNDREMQALLRKAKVQETPITVNIPELSWNGTAVLQEVQSHPWKGYIYHISFFAQK
ncbi:MAG TPA: 50S ribosomal protein L25 [Leptolyngbyaceae cyanobacterium]